MVAICAGAREGVGGQTGDVRFGSKADMCSALDDVRFTPKSGPLQCKTPCPLWAKSGHGAILLTGFDVQPYCLGRCKPPADGEYP